MTGNNLRPPQQKYKTALFRRQIIERLRLQLVTEEQVLTQLGISRTLLNQWNRTYQRYQHKWWFKPARFPRFVMKSRVSTTFKLLNRNWLTLKPLSNRSV